MNLINPKIHLLNQYRDLLGINEDHWPFVVNDRAIINYNFENVSVELNNYWNQYYDLFNNLLLNGSLSANPIEKHPYINEFENSNKRDFLVIGTMPPFSYVTESITPPIFPSILCRTQIGVNRIESIYNKAYNNIRPRMLFYYGNVGSFWEYVPNFDQDLNLDNSVEWMSNYSTNITDIISFCQRQNLSDPSDSNLYNIIPNFRIIDYILESLDLKTILFTSGWPSSDYLNNFKTSAFSIFFNTLKLLNINYEFNLFNQSNEVNHINDNIELIINKGLFKLNINARGKHKTINIICLPSPSGQAARSMNHHPFYSNWIINFNGSLPPTPTKVFRNNIYEMAFNRDYDALDLLQ